MAITVDIDTRKYIEDIRRAVCLHGLPSEVELVPDIQRWCEQHDVEEESPSRTAKILKGKESGRFLILLPERITSDMVSSALSGLEFRGFVSGIAQLSDPLGFIRHLVLHEIAHGLKNHMRTETE